MECKEQNTPSLSILGGRATCAQCGATSKRTGLRCKAPAMKGRTTCRFHGGKSTGPRSPEGKAKAAAGRTLHGRETKKKREERREALRQLEDLEAIGRVLGLIVGRRAAGRRVKR